MLKLEAGRRAFGQQILFFLLSVRLHRIFEPQAVLDSCMMPSNQLDWPHRLSDYQDKKSCSLYVLKILLNFATIEELLREVHEGELENVEWLLIKVQQVGHFMIKWLAWLQVNKALMQWLDVYQIGARSTLWHMCLLILSVFWAQLPSLSRLLSLSEMPLIRLLNRTSYHQQLCTFNICPEWAGYRPLALLI